MGNAFSNSSLLLTPNAVKTSKIYSVVPSDGSGDMLTTRATAATRVNSLGIIEDVGLNITRLNYDTIGGCPSILLEPQRTNLLTYSEIFTDTSWIKTNSTISANAITAPNGTLTADKIIEDTSTSTHRAFYALSIVSTSNFSFTVYAKAAERNWIRLGLFDGVMSSSCFFNVQDGTIGTSTSLISQSITQLSGGWYKCTITTNLTIPSSVQSQINISSANDVISYAGNGSSGLYIWGAQLEQGAYPTSYIPTVATAMTRNMDVILLASVYTKGLITSTGGTWFVELDNNFSLTRDTFSYGLYLNTINGGSGTGFCVRSPVSTGRFTIGKVIANSDNPMYTTLTNTVKIAIKWNGVTADFFVNGVKVVSATPFTTTNMEFLSSSPADSPRYLKSTMLFPLPLTDQELIDLTTI
jgi:hypothetical protein